MFNFFSEIKEKYGDKKEKLNPYQIVMVGDFLMYVEGCVTLMTLSKENIVFKAKSDVLIISGVNLTLKNLSKNTLAISGKINSWERV